jgi:hypothetical protein
VSWVASLVQEVEASPCEGNLELAIDLKFVCDPFAARGDKGEEEYP